MTRTQVIGAVIEVAISVYAFIEWADTSNGWALIAGIATFFCALNRVAWELHMREHR